MGPVMAEVVSLADRYRGRPLVEYYRKQGKFVSVEGEGSMDEIFKRIEKVLP